MPNRLSLIWISLLALISLSETAGSARGLPPRAFLSGSSEMGKGYSIAQVKNPNWKPRNVSSTSIYARPFLKHGISMPAPLKAAWNTLQTRDNTPSISVLEPRDGGQVVATSDGLFVFPVYIGTPRQLLHLVFDTGSGDFWVWSWLMPSSLLVGRDAYYNASASSSASLMDGQSWGVSYGSSEAFGVVWSDTVIMDAGNQFFGVVDNPVECAQGVDTFFQDFTGIDGIMGLSNAFNDSERPTPQESWTAYVLPNFPSSLFTISLVQGGVGTIDFGYINASQYSGSIAYTPVTIIPGTTGGFWAFDWTGFAIGSHPFNSTNTQILTDTGSFISLLPQSIADKYYAQVRGAYTQSDGSYLFPCSAKLPSFTFGVGSARIVIPGNYMLYAPVGNGICYGAVQPTTEDSYAYFSIPMFDALFVVHDYGGMQMGFAQRTFA